VEKSSQTIWAKSLNFHRITKLKTVPKGKNLPNLITLFSISVFAAKG
jgi:hypothetical protein